MGHNARRGDDGLDRSCPEEPELRNLLANASADTPMAEHVASCPDCRRRLEYMRAGATRLPSEIASSLGKADRHADASAFMGRFYVTGLVTEDEESIVYYGTHS